MGKVKQTKIVDYFRHLKKKKKKKIIDNKKKAKCFKKKKRKKRKKIKIQNNTLTQKYQPDPKYF